MEKSRKKIRKDLFYTKDERTGFRFKTYEEMIREIDHIYFKELMLHVCGSRDEAAEVSKIHRQTLTDKLKSYRMKL